MTPYETTKEFYTSCDLAKTINFCAGIGIVHIDKDCLLCAYPTHSSFINTKSKEAIEIQYKKGVDKPDTWYICFASGDLKKMFHVIEPKKFICYERFDNTPRLIEFNRMHRLINARET